MKYTLTITGASDDIIEIGGDISEEFNAYSRRDNSGAREAFILTVSDGSLFKVLYDSDGIWRVISVVRGGAGFSKVDGDVTADTNDVLTLTQDAPFKWVACNGKYAVGK